MGTCRTLKPLNALRTFGSLNAGRSFRSLRPLRTCWTLRSCITLLTLTEWNTGRPTTDTLSDIEVAVVGSEERETCGFGVVGGAIRKRACCVHGEGLSRITLIPFRARITLIPFGALRTGLTCGPFGAL